MTGFVRRVRDQVPPLSTILEIEGVLIVDQAGPTTPTGAGTGAVLLVGEFEDGLFGTEEDGIVEVFGEQDYLRQFGGFGFIYDGVPSQNPCARQHDGEFWNGNGFLKSFGLRAARLMIGRVDTSVGEVALSPLASILNNRNTPVALTAGMLLTITTDQGGPANSDAVAATAATVTGVAGTFPTLFVGGESIDITTNQGTKRVVFSATDQALADVIARINAAVGFTIADINGGQLRLTNTPQLGTGSFITLADVTAGTLAVLGHTAGTTNGTGNVANLGAVTMAEVAAIVNGSAALTAIDAAAEVTPDGFLRLMSTTPNVGEIEVTTTTMATALGISPLDTNVEAGDHEGGLIPAGTRVRTVGGLEWVTMQTLDIPEGNIGPYPVKVRPALDNGTAVGTGVGTVTVLVDQVPWSALVVSNAAALSAAKTEAQMDVAYNDVLIASLKTEQPAEEANYLLLARRTDTLVIYGTQNTKDAEAKGLFGRKYITGSRLGKTPAESIAEVANGRYDRKFYTALGLKVTVPAIAAVGEAGGIGFTADGVITVRPDGPLTTICAILAPELDPGQQTNLIDQFFEVDTFGNDVSMETYIAFKRAGIVAPRVKSGFGTFFQSSVTTDLDPARVEIFRRKMADFIQDTIPSFALKYCKRLNSQTVRDALLGEWSSFLSQLKSENAPDLARIEDFSVDDSANAGNSPTTLGQGLYFIKTKVRLFSSLKDIVFITEIGPQVTVSTEQAA